MFILVLAISRSCSIEPSCCRELFSVKCVVRDPPSILNWSPPNSSTHLTPTWLILFHSSQPHPVQPSDMCPTSSHNLPSLNLTPYYGNPAHLSTANSNSAHHPTSYPTSFHAQPTPPNLILQTCTIQPHTYLTLPISLSLLLLQPHPNPFPIPTLTNSRHLLAQIPL